MTLARAADLVAEASGRGSAVPAFNVITLEQAEAVVSGAAAAGSAVLLQVSENAIAFHSGYVPLLMACRELAAEAAVPVGIHLDHIVDQTLAAALIGDAVKLGIGSIMFDASRCDFETNCAQTEEVVRWAHAQGLWVEAELGEIGGKGGAHTPGVRTDPAEAALYIQRTGVDGLAIAVGSQHAMTTRSAVLDSGLVRTIASRVKVPLVLHGSTGVEARSLREAVAAGIRKVNVGTALTAAWTRSLRAELDRLDVATDPRAYFRAPRAYVARTVSEFCDLIGAQPETIAG